MSPLRGRLIKFVYSPDGPAAEVALIEPNGDETIVTCVLQGEKTVIGTTEGEQLQHLNVKYGDKTVCQTARRAASVL